MLNLLPFALVLEKVVLNIYPTRLSLGDNRIKVYFLKNILICGEKESKDFFDYNVYLFLFVVGLLPLL